MIRARKSRAESRVPPAGAALVLSVSALVAGPGLAWGQENAFPLEGLIVTAGPNPRAEESVAANVTVISGEALRRGGDRTLGEALRGVAGVDVVRGGSFGAVTSVFVRGGESDYTLVLVDGVQVNRPGGGFDFASLTTDNVERVEIVRGPSSALYGSDAVSGVIHVVTRGGRGPHRGSVSLRAGTFGRLDAGADVVGGTDRAGYSVSLSRRSTDGVLAFNNRHESTVLSGRARIEADERTEVGLAVRATNRTFHFPTDGSGAAVDRNAFTFDDHTTLALTVRRSLGERVAVQALLGASELDGGTDDAQDGPADTLGFYAFESLDHVRRTTAEVRAHLSVGGAVVTGGFEAERETQRSFNESSSQFGPSNGRSANERSNRAAFVHATGEASSLSWSLGTRVEDNARFGRFVAWQAGVSWLAPGRAGTRLRASAGTALKAPTFFENYATGFAVGNPDLEPERSRSWEAGVEQPLLERRLTLRATYFDQAFEDLIQYTFAPPSPGGPSFFNVAAADSRGVELDLSLDLGVVTAGATRTWLDTEVLDAGFDEGPGATFVPGEPLLRRPRSTWTVRADARVARGGRAFARLSRTGARSDRDFSTYPATPVELAPHDLLAAGVEWDVGAGGAGPAGLTLTVQLDNLLDERYEEVLGFRSPGRAVYLGARVAFGGGTGAGS